MNESGASVMGQVVCWVCLFLVRLPTLCQSSNFYYEQWKCNNYLSGETVTVRSSADRLLELHIRDNIQGEIEIKDGDINNNHIRVEIEKLGPTEDLTEGITVNHTLFDIGQGTKFVLQLDYVPRPKRKPTALIIIAIAGAVLLVFALLLLWWYYKRQSSSNSSLSSGDVNVPCDARRHSDVAETDNNAQDAACQSMPSVKSHQGGQELPDAVLLCSEVPRPPPNGESVCVEGSKNNSTCNNTNSIGGGNSVCLGRNTALTLTILGITGMVYANCPSQPLARVIIFIPPIFKLESVKIFFRHIHHNEVLIDHWLNRNGSKLQIFDLENASPTENPPCSARFLCPNSYIQNLGGCDAATGECICERGYDLDHGVCVDINECMFGLHRCPSTATCQNIIGSYLCHCGYGFYGDKKSCKPCSVGCPSGSFESSPCTNFGDRICQECVKCDGSQYEAKPCGGTSDRHCIHAAHPLLITGEMTTSRFLDGLKVEASSNVFMEDLHSTRNLETTYYVTDMTQASDFFWDRESGLRVNVGILNVHLIPEYTDVDHDSDNKYMLSDPNSSEDKTKFKNIIREYCRCVHVAGENVVRKHPIPDYYSITLEISRDRTTVAQNIICNKDDPSKPKCPPWYKDGDTFLHRTPNEACKKKGTFPEPLQSAANSIVCTARSAILKEIFNQTYSAEHPISFPPKRCNIAQSRCNQCITQPRCQVLDLFERKCCQVECYTLVDCKIAFSDECTTSPIECAQGDAYRYTIQPVFENIKAEHQCHIKHRHSKVLYELFYFIQIPGMGFQTSKVHKVVYASDAGYLSHGENQADFLTVEHNTGLELEDQFILKGRQGDSERINHTIYSMKSLEEQRSGKVIVHEISPKIFVASTQFEQPFDYSTSTWTRENDCNKNMSKFKMAVDQDEAFSQRVDIIIQNSVEPFHYFLKSIDNPPYIRFNVPGNVSILPYYFKEEDSPVLYTNSSLIATLELTSSGKVWDINLSGRMSGCPGYVGIVINNRLESEELFRYDLLVLCPPEFNITFKVPNWGQQPDKTFDVHLEDARHSYDIYLTQLTFEHAQIDVEPEAIQMLSQQEIPLEIFIGVGALLFASLIAFISVYVYTETAKEKQLMLAHQDDTRSENNRANAHQNSVINTNQSPTLRRIANQKASCGKHLCRIYVIFRMIYSVAFTFTLFYIVLMIFITKDIEQVTQIETIQFEKRNLTASISQAVEQHSNLEMNRQRELATSMQSACSHYIGELFDSLTLQMDKILASEMQWSNTYRFNASISSSMQERIRKRLKSFSSALDSFKHSFRLQMTFEILPSMAKYRNYLEDIFRNGWLNFPQRLFNESSYSDELAMSAVKAGTNLTGTVVDFGNFIEIQEVEEIQLWMAQFWQRFQQKFPRVTDMPGISTNTLQCQLTDIDEIPNLTRRTPFYHLHSSHYFTSHLRDEVPAVPKPSYGTTIQVEEYKLISHIEKGKLSEPPLVFSLGYYVESIDLDLLRLVFLILDATLLLYRLTLTCITAKALSRRFAVQFESRHWLPEEVQNKTNSVGPIVLHPSYNHDRELMVNFDGQELQIDPDITNQHNIYTDPQTLAIQNSTSPVPPWPGASPRMSAKVNTSEFSQYSSARVIFGRLIENTAFPKVVLLCMFIVLFYAFLKVMLFLLDVEFLMSIQAFAVFVNSLSVQVNQTNSYILEQAKEFNEIATRNFENQVHLELVNLQSMLDYFNTEQKRLVSNYVAELCSLAEPGQSKWGCDIRLMPQLLSIPIIPCNFVPIQPQLYSGFKVRDFESRLELSFQPCIEAARNIVFKTTYAVLIAITAMIVIHVFGWVASRCLRLKQRTPVRRIYVTSVPADSSIQTFIHRNEGSDYDSDDNEIEITRHTTVTNITTYRGRTGTTEFKYSETNV